MQLLGTQPDRALLRAIPYRQQRRAGTKVSIPANLDSVAGTADVKPQRVLILVSCDRSGPCRTRECSTHQKQHCEPGERRRKRQPAMHHDTHVEK